MPAIVRNVVTYVQKRRWILLVVLDLLAVPGIWFGQWLLSQMLVFGRPCNWTRFGAQCATCGGTHCVQAFLQGDFLGAFFYNPMVFCWILYGILTVVFLHLHILCKQAWAEALLRKMYSLTAFLIGFGVYLAFTVLRNLPQLLQWIL